MKIYELECFCEWLSSELYNKNVAVVGSSPNLLGKKYGELIDSHDIVIRFNNASVSGYENSVGCKTHLRFVGFRAGASHYKFFNSLAGNEKIISIAKNEEFFSSYKNGIILEYSFHRASYGLIDFLLNEKISERAEYQKPPRTGFALVTHLCFILPFLNSLNIFGMERGFRDEGPEHFYNDGVKLENIMKRREKNHCDIESELFLFNELLKNYSVGFYG
ncbi:hypothetical protein GCM10017767_10830 [Halomonas urumqiensis]|nr:hypothetical protein GCM10017767_10830 [Halomonas urumqiensis]